jgi:hypothetical protein
MKLLIMKFSATFCLKKRLTTKLKVYYFSALSVTLSEYIEYIILINVAL